jgi:hypothetical protein
MKKTVTLAIVILLVVTISIASVIVIEYATGNNWYDYTANVKSQQLESETLNFIKNILQLDYTKYYGKAGDLPNPENPATFQYLINYKNSTELTNYEKYQQMLVISYIDINHTSISFMISTLKV